MIPAFVAATGYTPPRQDRTGFTTPEPVYAGAQPTFLAPAPIPDRKARIRAAAHRAPKDYPGPVGLLIKRELEAAEEFGQALEQGGLTMQVVDQILGGNA